MEDGRANAAAMVEQNFKKSLRETPRSARTFRRVTSPIEDLLFYVRSGAESFKEWLLDWILYFSKTNE
jgi:hypothetical protein